MRFWNRKKKIYAHTHTKSKKKVVRKFSFFLVIVEWILKMCIRSAQIVMNYYFGNHATKDEYRIGVFSIRNLKRQLCWHRMDVEILWEKNKKRGRMDCARYFKMFPFEHTKMHVFVVHTAVYAVWTQLLFFSIAWVIQRNVIPLTVNVN